MKRKNIYVIITLLCMISTNAMGQSSDFTYGVFKHLGVGLSVSTTGIGFDVATDLTKYVGLRAGVSFMPSFNVNGDLEVEYYSLDGAPTSVEDEIKAKGSFKRTTCEVLVDLYPLGGSFFFTGGFSFGGDKLVGVTAHSDKIQELGLTGANVLIDKYQLPIDKNGDVNGEIRVNKFRPYLGIGFGSRAVPKGRLAFRTELGVQFHGHPKVTANGKDVLEIAGKAGDDDISKIVDELTVYPVLKFRLVGRIF